MLSRSLILFLYLLPALALSKPDCVCRAKGVVAQQGQIICLTTPSGKQLARCDRILNNTSWQFLQRDCGSEVS